MQNTATANSARLCRAQLKPQKPADISRPLFLKGIFHFTADIKFDNFFFIFYDYSENTVFPAASPQGM